MEQFMKDFAIFYATIQASIADFWIWFIDTIIGKIILFTLIISIFMWVIKLFIELKE